MLYKCVPLPRLFHSMMVLIGYFPRQEEKANFLELHAKRLADENASLASLAQTVHDLEIGNTSSSLSL